MLLSRLDNSGVGGYLEVGNNWEGLAAPKGPQPEAQKAEAGIGFLGGAASPLPTS